MIRKAETTDVAEIMKVMEAARAIMRSSGNMHQWIGGYPSEAVILSDIEKQGGFVVEDEARVVAYFAFLQSPEPTYHIIYDGEWLDAEQPYHVVHRIGSYPDRHGIFREIMDYCFSAGGSPAEGCLPPMGSRNIRIDTHRDNAIMRHCLAEYGFTYCGIIYLANGDERLAYQKIEP